MAVTSTTSQSPLHKPPELAVQNQLRHLAVVNDIYAETPDRRFHAILGDRYHMWRLVSRDGEFPPQPRRTVVECDAWLTVWLARKTEARATR